VAAAEDQDGWQPGDSASECSAPGYDASWEEGLEAFAEADEAIGQPTPNVDECQALEDSEMDYEFSCGGIEGVPPAPVKPSRAAIEEAFHSPPFRHGAAYAQSCRVDPYALPPDLRSEAIPECGAAYSILSALREMGYEEDAWGRALTADTADRSPPAPEAHPTGAPQPKATRARAQARRTRFPPADDRDTGDPADEEPPEEAPDRPPQRSKHARAGDFRAAFKSSYFAFSMDQLLRLVHDPKFLKALQDLRTALEEQDAEVSLISMGADETTTTDLPMEDLLGMIHAATENTSRTLPEAVAHVGSALMARSWAPEVAESTASPSSPEQAQSPGGPSGPTTRRLPPSDQVPRPDRKPHEYNQFKFPPRKEALKEKNVRFAEQRKQNQESASGILRRDQEKFMFTFPPANGKTFSIVFPFGRMCCCFGFISLTSDEVLYRLLVGFDTGAEHNLISLRALAKAKKWITADTTCRVGKPTDRLAMMALGARPLHVIGVVQKFPVRIKHVLLRLDLLVVASMSKDILFGRPAMRTYTTNVQEGDIPIISMKVPKADFIEKLTPPTLKQQPAYKGAPAEALLPLRLTTTNGLFAQWYETTRTCTEVLKEDINAMVGPADNRHPSS
jgi:hypothetical protein